MNDNKGAYIPFRDLLVNQVNVNWEYRDEAIDDEDMRMVRHYEEKAQKSQYSLSHYKELLKIHGMEEVK